MWKVRRLAALAPEYGSKFRKEFEKEKSGPHGEYVDWKTLRPGLEYRTIDRLGDEDDLDAHAVRIDLDQWDLHAALVGRATGRMLAREIRSGSSFDRVR